MRSEETRLYTTWLGMEEENTTFRCEGCDGVFALEQMQRASWSHKLCPHCAKLLPCDLCGQLITPPPNYKESTELFCHNCHHL